jgi:phage shock protein PspC (stress-responsive transcriptional regulator)
VTAPSTRGLVPEAPGRDDVDMNRLVRPQQGRLIAGVCAGLAERFGCSVIPIRLLTIAATAFFGVSIGIYLLLWILMPSER